MLWVSPDPTVLLIGWMTPRKKSKLIDHSYLYPLKMEPSSLEAKNGTWRQEEGGALCGLEAISFF